MALGKKTGGRPFVKGPDPRRGNNKGKKIDRMSRKTFREIFLNALDQAGLKIERGVIRQLSRGHPFMVRTGAEYVDGKPVQEVRIRPLQPLQIILTPEEEGEDEPR